MFEHFPHILKVAISEGITQFQHVLQPLFCLKPNSEYQISFYRCRDMILNRKTGVCCWICYPCLLCWVPSIIRLLKCFSCLWMPSTKSLYLSSPTCFSCCLAMWFSAKLQTITYFSRGEKGDIDQTFFMHTSLTLWNKGSQSAQILKFYIFLWGTTGICLVCSWIYCTTCMYTVFMNHKTYGH